MSGGGASYEVLEHTADAGVIARGRTLAEAFEGAALGMYALMADLDCVRRVEERSVEVRAPDRERLLVAWLLELLFLTETEDLLFSEFEVETLGDTALRARARGEPLDPGRHRPGVAVKAVTYHMLEVAEEDGGYRVRVIFDI